jgi:hypothetical protein
MDPELVDRIYECSLVPEFWPGVLDELGRIAEATEGRCLSPKPTFNIGPLRLRTMTARKEWRAKVGSGVDKPQLARLPHAMPDF